MVELTWEGKYTAEGKRVTPVRLALPFQDVETVNESAQTRNLMLDLFARNQPGEWRNRLIWGDKKYVLPSLLPEFAGKVDLVYIDPPFTTGNDFSYTAEIPNHPNGGDESVSFLKVPSVIEQKAYRDTWGRGLDSYLQWFYESAVFLHELLATSGSIYVHCDWRLNSSLRLVLDEVFGAGCFRNEIAWHYSGWNKRLLGSFERRHDSILFYAKSENQKFNSYFEPWKSKEEYVRKRKQQVRLDEAGREYVLSDAGGGRRVKMYLDDVIQQGVVVDDVWRLDKLNNSASESFGYPTQKPEAFLERVLKASSNEGDLILDCFCGSGTTAAVAEKLGRRWIAADLGRFAIHTTRKRLLSIPDVRPFVVQNLGKYERQAWQAAEFGVDKDKAAFAQARYRHFMLDLYGAQPLNGYTWLHGVKAGRMVHVGSVDAPVLLGDIKAIAQEFWQAVGKDTGATVNSVDVLGWDFAFELNEMGKQMAADANIKMTFKRIPREVLEKKAVEQGDIRFFELAALDVAVVPGPGHKVCVELQDFMISPDDVPEEVQRAITHWSQWIDYWAIDWDHKGDTFHNQWQSYRTKKQPRLDLRATNEYQGAGAHTIVIKVIDILGNDTTKSVRVEVG